MSHQSDQPSVPRAVIHKHILDAAADKPDLAMDAIASEISMATTGLVERVLDEYGDPANEQNNESPNPKIPMAQERTPVADDNVSG